MEYDDRERKWHNLQQEALEKRLVWLDEPPRLVVHSSASCLLCCLSSAPALAFEESCILLQQTQQAGMVLQIMQCFAVCLGSLPD